MERKRYEMCVICLLEHTGHARCLSVSLTVAHAWKLAPCKLARRLDDGKYRKHKDKWYAMLALYLLRLRLYAD